GEKLVANEFLAYLHFTNDIKDGMQFSLKTTVAITVALCGFANFVGVGILMAGLGAVIPERKKEISNLGMKSLLAGTLSNFMSASLVGIALWVATLFGLTPLG
ncbi:MAG TPA: NupC/NupG family nucleoside CNT transporter, partial [Rhizobiales bacterium]|nr:NupC/NupG family nucleoside CNT transporter [Hyphomicrobiales bacterium]